MRYATTFAFSVLRFGLGVTFLVIGYLIWQDPAGWGGFIQPWAQAYLLRSVEETMRATAVVDMVLGAMLVLGIKTWLASLVAALHLLIVLITVGFNDITVRDFGLMMASFAVFIAAMPPALKRRFRLV